MDSLDALRGMDEQVLKRTALEGSLARDQQELARLSAQLRQLDEQIAEARRSGPQPDRAGLGASQTDLVAGSARLRNAAAAGAGTFAALWLLCVLMILKNPLRRPRREPLLAAAVPLAAPSHDREAAVVSASVAFAAQPLPDPGPKGRSGADERGSDKMRTA
jgi:hypothetical protein